MENTEEVRNISRSQLHHSPQFDLMNLQREFFRDLESKGRSPNTLKNYKTDLECFNQYLSQHSGPGQQMDQFQLPQVLEYGKHLQQKYKSDNSRRRRVQALRMFFDFLVEKGLYETNPVRKIPSSPKFLDIPRPTPFVDVKTFWTALLEETQITKPMPKLMATRNQVIMLLIFGSGLKVSDLAKLKRDQIIFPTSDDEPARVLVTPPKRDPYSVPLPRVFESIFTDYITLLDKLKESSQAQFDELLFNANPYRILSGGLSPRGLEIVFEEYRKKLMIKLTPKSLRQACIFKWLRQSYDESLIKEWMGVAPSYGLKLYRDHLPQHIYDDLFLEEMYFHYLKRFEV